MDHIDNLRQVAEMYRDHNWQCVITSSDRSRQACGYISDVTADSVTTAAGETFRLDDILELAPVAD